MGVVLRQSVITSIISYAGVVLGYINLLYLYPKYLATEQIGLLRTIQDAGLLLAPFAQFGLSHSILRFFPGLSKGDDKGNKFISLALLLSLGGFGLFTLIFFLLKQPLLGFFRENATELADYTSLILWLTFLVMLVTLFEYYSRSLLKVVFPNLLREVGLRFMQLILVTLYFYGHLSFDQFLTLSVAIYLISLVLLVGYLVLTAGFRLRFNFQDIPISKMKEILTYSSLSFVGTSASIIIAKMDSLMVTGLKGFSMNAIYTTAFYMATVIEIPKRAILQSSTTLLSRAFENKDLMEVETIYRKAAINQAVIGTLLLIGVWANLTNIFTIMPKGETYEAGAYVVLVVGLARLVDMAFGPSSEVIVLSKYYWFNLIVVALLAVSGLVLNLLLIPEYGVVGAAIATAIAISLFNLVKFFFIRYKLHIQPFTPAFLKLALIGAFVVLINYWLPQLGNPYADAFYRSAVITSLYGGSVLYFRVSAEVNNTMARLPQFLRGR